MFVLWRKVDLAETAYFRPLAGYSSSSLNNSKQLDVLKRGKLQNRLIRKVSEKVVLEREHYRFFKIKI